jgi:hypothetical protein
MAKDNPCPQAENKTANLIFHFCPFGPIQRIKMATNARIIRGTANARIMEPSCSKWKQLLQNFSHKRTSSGMLRNKASGSGWYRTPIISLNELSFRKRDSLSAPVEAVQFLTLHFLQQALEHDTDQKSESERECKKQ